MGFHGIFHGIEWDVQNPVSDRKPRDSLSEHFRCKRERVSFLEESCKIVTPHGKPFTWSDQQKWDNHWEFSHFLDSVVQSGAYLK